jgi:hypothetical protein
MDRRAAVLAAAAVLAVLGCYLVLLNQASAQRAAQEQYGADGQGTPAPDQGTPAPDEGRGGADMVTICHATGSETNPYRTITVDRNSVIYQGHLGHPDDIIPATAGGCPSGPTPAPTTPEPTTPEPTATASATATTEPTDDGGCPVPEPTTASPTASATASATASVTAEPTPTPEPTTTEPPTPEPTTASPSATAGGSPTATATPPITVVPTTPASPTATASATEEPTATQTGTASPGFTPTPTAVATNPGENPDGPFEVTDPDGKVSTLSFYDLDVHDDPPLPGGSGGITRSEMRGQRAAAQTLVEGGDFHEAVAAAQPFLNACDSRDAVRLAAVQLGIPMPDTGGASLGLIAAVLLLGTGLFAWQLGVRGRR